MCTVTDRGLIAVLHMSVVAVGSALARATADGLSLTYKMDLVLD